MGNGLDRACLGLGDLSDVAEKENKEPIAFEVLTVKLGLSLCLFVEFCSHLTNIQNFWLLCLSVLMRQLERAELTLSCSYGKVSSNWYFMLHCL